MNFNGEIDRGNFRYTDWPSGVERRRCNRDSADPGPDPGAGYGDQVNSWLSEGKNLPISAQQLQEVLGNDTVRQLAAKYGIPVDQLSTVLAQVLPKAVDQASPKGTLPHTA